MATHIRRISSRTAEVLRKLPLRTQAAVDAAADDLRRHLKDALDSGALPIQSDTVALAESLSVQTPRGSDSTARVAAARARYLAGGHWMDPVREHVDPEAYTAAHFDERMAAEEPLPMRPGLAIAGVFTQLGYGMWWENGHQNVFTGNYEHRPWMFPVLSQWAKSSFADHFKGVISGI